MRGEGSRVRLKEKHDSPSHSQVPEDLMEKAKIRIQDRIKKAKKNQKPGKEFICKDDVKNIWEADDIRAIFPSSPPWTHEELGKIREYYILTISILVLIDWSHTEDFRSVFFDFNGEGGRRTDERIPYPTSHALAFLGASQQIFYDTQWQFKPFVIKLRKETYHQTVDASARLPFIEDEVVLGCGGFGKVHKVKVSRFHLEDVGGYTNQQEKELACKRFEFNQSEESFKKEVDNLQVLKESLS
ncbi:hypothetical protein GJ744_006166 [Endocarpon pusillum]|uniref:Protein kinase domain-containing protein n=1 Tax=Endocarpon pusillum TaxID=364733 RepID=A0A8H7DY35_9EURO|nr:hypothetical protein GJ744_006166 [Endocarpon pusillum]